MLVLAVALLSIAAWYFIRHRWHAAAPPPTPTRRVLAAKRTVWLHSGKVWTLAEASRLHDDIAALAGAEPFPASTGILVQDGRDGRALYSLNSHLALVPGSTMKLITAAAAIQALGAEHRFVTRLVSDGSIDGTQLNGNLWLVGGGDPELTSDDLRRGIHVLQLAGVGQINGNVYVDGSRYGPDNVSTSWLREDLQFGWAAPATALSLNGGSVQFTITPRAGTQADISVDPPGEHVIASVETATADADNTLRIDALPDGSGYLVSGQIPFGAPQQYWRAVPHPTQAAATSLVAMLRLAGVTVGGSAGADPAPAKSNVLWQHQSRTLDLIIKHMFLLSDNHYAEELLRAVGWNATGLGTLDNSLHAERAFLQANDLPASEAVLADGSGLSGANRLSAQSLAATLRFLLEQPLPEAPFTLLPRAGMEGTVAVRQLAPQALGRVYAKDGYIDGASAIAGYVITAHHGPVIFVFLVNDWQHGLDAVWSAEDQMLDTIAQM